MLDHRLSEQPDSLASASTVGSPLPPTTSYRAGWSLPGPDLHRQAHCDFVSTPISPVSSVDSMSVPPSLHQRVLGCCTSKVFAPSMAFA